MPITNREVQYHLTMRSDAENTLRNLQIDLRNVRAGLKDLEIGSSAFDTLKTKEAALVATTKEAKAVQAGFLADLKSNWMGLTAAAAGAGIAIHKALELIEDAAKADQAFMAFNATMKQLGVDGKKVFEELKQSASGLVDDSHLAQMATEAANLGIPVDKLGELLLIARAKSRDFGITTEEAFQRIINSIGAGNVRALTHLGLVDKLSATNKNLANAIGETSSSLTGQEQKMALLNMVIDKGKESTDKYNLSTLTSVERIQKVRVEIDELKESVGRFLSGMETMGIAFTDELMSFFQAGATGIFGILSTVEIGMNKLGLNNSTYFQDLTKQSAATYNKLQKDAEDAFKAAGDEARGVGVKAGEGLTAVVDPLKGIETELDKAKAKLEEISRTDSLTDLRNKTSALNSVMALLPITTEAGRAEYKRLNAELDATTAKMEHLQRTLKGLGPDLFDLKFKIQVDASAANMMETVAQYRKNLEEAFALGPPIKSPLSGVPALTPEDEAHINDRVNISGQLADKEYEIFTDEKQKEQDALTKWEANAVEMAHGNEDLITHAHAIAEAERLKITQRDFKEGMQTAVSFAQQAFQLIGRASAQEHQGEINRLQTEKAATDAKYNAELAAINQSTAEGKAQYKSLTDAKAAADAAYDRQIADEKRHAFEGQKDAQEIQAIINTAEEITKVLATPWMIPVVAGLGAAEIAIIASQPTPSFDEGGVAVVHHGEVIRTPLQEGELLKTLSHYGKEQLNHLASIDATNLKSDLDILESNRISTLEIAELDLIRQETQKADLLLQEHSHQFDSIIQEIKTARTRGISHLPILEGTVFDLLSFDEGGLVPGLLGHPVPAILHAGEAVYTPEQEKRMKEQSVLGETVINNNSMSIYVNGPIASKEAFKQIVQDGMREMGVTDVAAYFRQNRNSAVLG